MNADQLVELERLGGLQFQFSECGIILGVDNIDDLAKESPGVQLAYDRGRLKADAEVRTAILEQAKQGSTPAQKQMQVLIRQAEQAS